MFKTQKADWYFIVAASLAWVAALAVTVWDFVALQSAAFHFGLLTWIGLVFIVTGLALRMFARKALGKHFSYALRTLDKHELITDGTYAHLRHPAYTGDLLFQFGVPLLFSSLYGFLVMLLLIPCFLYRISIEEKMLVEKFGSEYQNYQHTSKKLFPYIY